MENKVTKLEFLHTSFINTKGNVGKILISVSRYVKVKCIWKVPKKERRKSEEQGP